LYTLDFHNSPKKIHITHLKRASNVSFNRRRLEIIRQRKRNYGTGKIATPTNITNDKVDEIWTDQHIQDNED
jgi:ribosomal protein S12 methylthiotransferase accessory factor YcaO